MGVTVEFDNFEEVFEKEYQVLKESVKAEFKSEGENTTLKAKKNGNYPDRTGDLRNGVGYAVIDNGISSSNANQKTTQFIKAHDTSGVGLILANGEDYATLVEAKGYEVISKTGIEMEETLKRVFDAGN